MTRKRRDNYDGMAISHLPRWYVAYDMFRNIVECEILPPGANLWAVLREVMETRAARGWEIEDVDEPRFGNFFCRKDGARLFITIQPTDPHKLPEGSFRPNGPSTTRDNSANATDMQASPNGSDRSASTDEETTPSADRHPN